MTQKYIIGSISSGTMRPEDLIPVFLSTLEDLDPERAKQIREDKENKLVFEWLDDTDNDKPEAADYLLDELFDALNEYAPPYFYFGSHPDDGADYGFWLSEDFEQDFEGLKVKDTSEVPADYTGEVLHVSDHGNPTLYDAENGKLTEVWSLV